MLWDLSQRGELAARLQHSGDGITAKGEPSSRFLGGFRLITVLGSDLSTLPWRARMQLIGEHLFPSRAYMRARYPLCPSVLLPFAYVGRIARGRTEVVEALPMKAHHRVRAS